MLDCAHLLRSPEVDHLVKVVDAEEEHGGLLELAHGVDAVLQPLLDHFGQLSKQVALRPRILDYNTGLPITLKSC